MHSSRSLTRDDDVARIGARELYDWVERRVGAERPFTYADIERSTGTGWRQARVVMPEVARIAHARGLCLTTACAANGYTMMLTARAEVVQHSWIHVGHTREGVHRRELLMFEFIEARNAHRYQPRHAAEVRADVDG
jgi:hypothetical protein